MRIKCGWCVVLLIVLPHVARAQDGQSVEEVLSFLATNRAVQTDDFVRDREAADATRATLSRALLVELTTFPLTTSSGGFSYRFNPEIGTMQRVTQSFGPFFVDRASTAGKGTVAMSVTYRRAQYASLDDRDLRDGTLVTTSNKFRDEPRPFDFETLSLDIHTDTVTLFANVGLTDRIDLGVAVPVVSVAVDGERVNNYRGTATVQARGRAESGGLADIALRSKQQLIRKPGWGLASSVDVYLPTGDPEDLRGSGETALKASAIVSASTGDLEWHGNAGFVFGGTTNHSIFGAAMSAVVADRVTFSGETLVRYIKGAGAIREVVQAHPLFSGVDTIRLLPSEDAAASVTAVAGIRWNVTSTLLVNSYVIFPVAGSTLAARAIPAVSVDYSFVP